MSTATIDSTDALKRLRAVELLTAWPEMSTREIAREVGMPESTLRKVKADFEATKLQLVVLRLCDIRTDGGTQTRAAMSERKVAEYAEAYEANAPMPPPVVFSDGDDSWLADGFHRHAGASRAGLVGLACEVRQGTKRDALAFSLSANAHHALERTNEDKRNAVRIAFADPEWAKTTDAAIARLCGVSAPLVATVREELAATLSIQSGTVRTDRKGREINTANIGKKRGGVKQDEDEDEEPVRRNGSAPAVREPGCDDDRDEPAAHDVPGDPAPSDEQAYLDSFPIRAELPDRCRAVFDRDALDHRKAARWLDEGKRLGLAATKTGEPQGAWQFQAARFLRLAYPHAWLRCAADGCDGGLRADGSQCDRCYGRGYRLP